MVGTCGAAAAQERTPMLLPGSRAKATCARWGQLLRQSWAAAPPGGHAPCALPRRCWTRTAAPCCSASSSGRAWSTTPPPLCFCVRCSASGKAALQRACQGAAWRRRKGCGCRPQRPLAAPSATLPNLMLSAPPAGPQQELPAECRHAEPHRPQLWPAVCAVPAAGRRRGPLLRIPHQALVRPVSLRCCCCCAVLVCRGSSLLC